MSMIISAGNGYIGGGEGTHCFEVPVNDLWVIVYKALSWLVRARGEMTFTMKVLESPSDIDQ